MATTFSRERPGQAGDLAQALEYTTLEYTTSELREWGLYEALKLIRWGMRNGQLPKRRVEHESGRPFSVREADILAWSYPPLLELLPEMRRHKKTKMRDARGSRPGEVLRDLNERTELYRIDGQALQAGSDIEGVPGELVECMTDWVRDFNAWLVAVVAALSPQQQVQVARVWKRLRNSQSMRSP